MLSFRKRTYRSFGHFKRDLRFMVRNWRTVRKIKKEKLIPPTFLERLVITVTAVNGCRYCSQFHARHALLVGLSRKEITELLDGNIGQYPDEEVVGILYARHWAETGANPDPKARQKLLDTYGKEKTRIIEIVLNAIHIANLVGNTWDHFLYRI